MNYILDSILPLPFKGIAHMMLYQISFYLNTKTEVSQNTGIKVGYQLVRASW